MTCCGCGNEVTLEELDGMHCPWCRCVNFDDEEVDDD